MDKIAEMSRYAEIRGAMAAFCDRGIVKVASDQAFDNLVDDVCTALGNDFDYDLQKVAAVTDAILQGVPAQHIKEASEDSMLKVAACKQDLGEILFAKLAGEISDREFTQLVREQQVKMAANLAAERAASKRNRQWASMTPVKSGRAAVPTSRAREISNLIPPKAARKTVPAPEVLEDVAEAAPSLRARLRGALSGATDRVRGAMSGATDRVRGAMSGPAARRAAYGTAGLAGLGALAYGGKKLYDNYAE